ncbi:MAG: S26 family signal peptidase [Phycisphaerales bacterium]
MTSTHPTGSDPASPFPGPRPKETIQDIIVSVVIAFTLAFVFRGFVVEAFVIPTGSMAPTLMGAHERIRSPETGYTWPVGPWYAASGTDNEYKPVQGKAPDLPLELHDPMTGEELIRKDVPRKSGDRILVLKYLYMLMEPTRFDVIVFKCPYKPADNFIKRLVGLPGEELAIVDGDIFFRPAPTPDSRMHNPDGSLKNPWADSDWKIARKPQQVQDATWQTVFNSDFAPRGSVVSVNNTFASPWTSDQSAWKLDGRRFQYPSSDATELVWDSNKPRLRFRYHSPYPEISSFDDFWEINDRYAYNETPQTSFQHQIMRGGPFRPFFPVSDIRMSAGIEPAAPGLSVTATIAARSHEFQMVIAGSTCSLRMRHVRDPDYKTVAQATISELSPGDVTNLQFVHVDQSLQAWINGRKVAAADYNWGPDERIRMATQSTVDELLKRENGSGLDGDLASMKNIFEERSIYQKPRISWTFSGAPVTMHRVRVDRDLHYTSTLMPQSGVPSRGSTPKKPILLGKDQFFVCGDNSPASHDARVWDAPDPWVQQIDPTPGVVPRKLILGKAFFVYYPAPTWVYGRIPVPDFGRMRFIW